MDVIIHAAGLNADGCQKSIIEAYEINVIKTAKILDSAIKNNVKQFIYLSTAHVYGELHGKIIESATPEPIHPYGLSKFAGEEVVKYFSRKDGKINYQILRLANVFGPPKGDNQTCWNLLVNDLCLQAIKNAKLRLNTNGLHSRNFLTMQDFLESIAHFLKNQDMSGVYNVGTEKSTTIMEMAELISERYYLLFGKKIYIEKNEDDKSEKNHILYDCSKLVSTGFQFTNKFSNEIDDILKMLTILRGMKI
jgi:UDP-glucose 4-epimerase